MSAYEWYFAQEYQNKVSGGADGADNHTYTDYSVVFKMDSH